MKFGTFAGNPAVKETLCALIDKGHFPHALLLEGPAGSGRRCLAMQIARAAVCREENGALRPCGHCVACEKTEHPDITVLDGDIRPISVDDIRDLRQQLFVMPNESAYRVAILAQAQAMNIPAQNALLKILEEPPAHALIFLTCENRAQLLETVRSRCLSLTLGGIDIEEALPVLRRALPRESDQALQDAHRLFGGVVGAVITGMEDGTMKNALSLIPRFAEGIIGQNEAQLMCLTGALEKDKPLTESVLNGLILVFRDALMMQSGASCSPLSTAEASARKLANRLPGVRLMALIEQTRLCQQDLKRNMNNTLLLTRLCACLRQAAGY